MSKNLNAFLRYKTIHECLSKKNNKKWDWPDLAKACGQALKETRNVDNIPSRRTILSDINMMRSGDLGYHAPIAWSRQMGYHYTDSHFSIYEYPLSEMERVEFEKGVEIIKQFSEHLGMPELDQIITKLHHIINAHSHIGTPIIRFDTWIHESGYKWLNLLYQNIKNQQALFISYRPFGHQSNFSGIVSPYLLKEYRNRWYLIAKFHNDNTIYHYALDRLRDAKASLQEFRPEEDFEPDKYFEQIIGITIPRDGQLTKIQFRATYTQANYIITKPIHLSQQIVSQNKDYTVFEIEVIPNYELESTLLAFGEQVEILSPAYLRKKVKERIVKMAQLYQ